MTMKWIRDTYGVPAKRGMRVIADEKPGKITSSSGPYIYVLIDGWKRSFPYHPTWRMQYLQGTQDKSKSLEKKDDLQ